jgi:hypothetical protein
MAMSGKIDYRQLMFVNMMLPFIKPEGAQAIDQDIDNFVQALKQQSQKSDCTWQKILNAFNFTAESKSIDKFL